MRVIHTADIHLGLEPEKGFDWAENRGKELWETFEALIAYTEKKHADFLLIAGDLFHRQPLLRELKEVNYLFSTLTGTKVILMAGNHDYIKQDSYYRNFPWCEAVTFLKSTSIAHCYFEDCNTAVYGGSYYDKTDNCPVYDHLHPKDHKAINILLAHGGDEKHRPYSLERLRDSGFDYIALGHIHKKEVLLENRIIQSGGPEPLDINETGEKGFFEGELTKTGSHFTFVPFSKRKCIHANIPIAPEDTRISVGRKISQFMEEQGREHIYKFILTGFRDEVVNFTGDEYMNLGNISRLEDRTRPDYNLEALYRENKNNVLGWYMKEFLDKEDLGEMEREALHYGIRALTLGE